MGTRFGRIAVLGGGSWATALSKIILRNAPEILWYMRRPDRIEDFVKTGHNPVYLSDVSFEVDRIEFSPDINYVCREADTLVLAVPSPYFKSHIDKLTEDLSGKIVVSAVKGIVPDDNMIITDWLHEHKGVKMENLLAIGGPCHAEEVALERLSYLTVACHDAQKSRDFCDVIRARQLKAVSSTDVEGVEYAAVLKNVYAIMAGIVSGMKAGDNFMAMLVCNAAREMRRFLDSVAPVPRNICESAYLGDLLVTSYSRFSRNHNFGSMIGKGYSVTAAKMEMEMVAEGYYGTKCIHELNQTRGVHMPIADAAYSILYEKASPRTAIRGIADSFN